MNDPDFLDLEDVLLIHREQLARFGGGDGLRDQGLLESAIATPRATFGGRFVHESLFAMAGAYAFHIAENQPLRRHDRHRRAPAGQGGDGGAAGAAVPAGRRRGRAPVARPWFVRSEPHERHHRSLARARADLGWGSGSRSGWTHASNSPGVASALRDSYRLP